MTHRQTELYEFMEVREALKIAAHNTSCGTCGLYYKSEQRSDKQTDIWQYM